MPHYEAVLCEDAGIRIGRWDKGEVYRPRWRVVKRLMEEWSAWPDPTLEAFDVLADGEHVAIEFRIQATEHDRYVEHNRSAFLTIKDGKIYTIDLYCPEPLPSARRKGWIAPATLTEDEIHRLFDSMQHSFDIREWIPPDESGSRSLRGGMGGSGSAHPGSNGVGGYAGRQKRPIGALKKPLLIIANATLDFSGGWGRMTRRPTCVNAWNATA